jgi:hypothetical protein
VPTPQPLLRTDSTTHVSEFFSKNRPFGLREQKGKGALPQRHQALASGRTTKIHMLRHDRGCKPMSSGRPKAASHLPVLAAPVRGSFGRPSSHGRRMVPEASLYAASVVLLAHDWLALETRSHRVTLVISDIGTKLTCQSVQRTSAKEGILLKKSVVIDDQQIRTLLARPADDNVRDHVGSHKSDPGSS